MSDTISHVTCQHVLNFMRLSFAKQAQQAHADDAFPLDHAPQVVRSAGAVTEDDDFGVTLTSTTTSSSQRGRPGARPAAHASMGAGALRSIGGGTQALTGPAAGVGGGMGALGATQQGGAGAGQHHPRSGMLTGAGTQAGGGAGAATSVPGGVHPAADAVHACMERCMELLQVRRHIWVYAAGT